MKLLVAIDSSEVSRTVVSEVARRPWPPGTIACVLHIIDWPPLPGDASLIQTVKQSASLLVKEAADKLDKTGLQSHFQARRGSSSVCRRRVRKRVGRRPGSGWFARNERRGPFSARQRRSGNTSQVSLLGGNRAEGHLEVHSDD